MADVKISALPAAIYADLTDDDVVPMVDAGASATKKITFALIKQRLWDTPVITTNLRVNGPIGVNIAPAANIAMRFNGAITAGSASQWSVYNDATFSSAATSEGGGFFSQVKTAAAAFTMTAAYGYYASGASVGAGSAITTSYGLFVANQGAAGITNAYGIYVAAQSGAATRNYALRVAGGLTLIGTTEQSNASVMVSMPLTASAGLGLGLYVYSPLSAAANADQLMSFRVDTPFIPGAYTGIIARGIYMSSLSTVGYTSPGDPRGVEIGTVTGTGATNAYGLYLGGVSGATNNYAIYTNGAAQVRFGGMTTMAASAGIGTSAITSAALDVEVATLSGATTQFGVYQQSTFGSGATVAGYSYYSRVRTTAAAFTMTDAYGMYIADANKGAGSTITNLYGLYVVAPTQGGTINRGIYNGGDSHFVGTVSIGGNAPVPQMGLQVNNTTLSGATTQQGIVSGASYGSGATVAGYGVTSKITTQAAAFTMSAAVAFQAWTPVLGAGSAITNSYGLYVQNQGATGVTTAMGVYIEAQSGAATTNMGLYNAGTSRFDKPIGINSNPTTNVAIYMTGYGMLATNTQYGIYNQLGFGSAATSAGYSEYTEFRTDSGAWTMTTGYAKYIAAPTIGNTAVTSIYGAYVANQGQAKSTNAYGVYIAAQSGAATTNIGLYNAGTTLLNDRVGMGISPQNGVGLDVEYTTLSGASQFGVISQPAFSATATTAIAVYAASKTAASAFTLGASRVFQAASPVVGATSAITTQVGFLANNQGAAGITNAYGVYIDAQSGAATTNIGLYNAGTTQLQSPVGMAVAPAWHTALNISSSFALSGATSQTGIGNNATFGSDATVAGYGIYSRVFTTAAAYTLTSAFSFFANTPSLGASSAITNMYGFYAGNQGVSGVTNAYGVYIAAQSGAATINIGLRNVGTTWLNEFTAVGGTAPSTDVMLYVRGSSSLTGGTQYGVATDVTFTASGTDVRAFYGKVRSTAAAYTITSAYGVLIDAPTVGAGSAITTNRGVYIANQGAANITNAYGVVIDAQSGASGVNIGLYNVGTTRLDSALAFGAAPGASKGINMASSFSVTAAAGVAYGAVFSPTLVAAANNDALYTLRIDSNSTPGAYTGLARRGIQVAAFSVAAFTTPADPAGVAIDVVTGTGAANAYALLLSPPTGATNSYLIAHTTPATFSVKADGSLLNASSILSSSATGGIGYTTGAGGTVTQATSRTTGVTLNKVCGAITLFTAAGSATATTFTVTNSTVAATDVINLSVKSGTNVYIAVVSAVAAGSFNITFWTTGGTASDAPVINFEVIKAVTA